MEFYNKQAIFARGAKFILRKSKDDTSWKKLSHFSHNIYSIAATDTHIIYATGDNGLIIKSINSGKTWDTLNSGTTENLGGIAFTNKNTGYVAGESGHILKTKDAGTNWDFVNTNTTNILHDFCFVDSDTGYCVGAHNIILKTTDAGENWYVVCDRSGSYDIDFMDNYGYAISGSGLIETTDYGNTWKNIQSPASRSFSAITINNGHVSCVGWDGIILKYTPDHDMLTSARNTFNSPTYPLSSENLLYPNPTTGTVNIDLGSYKGASRIHVYSTEGVKIASYHTTGSSPTLSLGNVAPGLYFVEIKTDTERFVKKLMVR